MEVDWVANDDKSFYTPGRGSNFTPSRSATWTEYFNNYFVETKKKNSRASRNWLTEELITDGLKHRGIIKTEEKSLLLSLEGFSDEAIDFLQTEDAKQMLMIFARSLTNQVIGTTIRESPGTKSKEMADSTPVPVIKDSSPSSSEQQISRTPDEFTVKPVDEDNNYIEQRSSEEIINDDEEDDLLSEAGHFLQGMKI